MQIFVDADACPVVAIIEKIAKDNSVPVMLLCDTNHVLSSTYTGRIPTVLTMRTTGLLQLIFFRSSEHISWTT